VSRMCICACRGKLTHDRLDQTISWPEDPASFDPEEADTAMEKLSECGGREGCVQLNGSENLQDRFTPTRGDTERNNDEQAVSWSSFALRS